MITIAVAATPMPPAARPELTVVFPALEKEHIPVKCGLGFEQIAAADASGAESASSAAVATTLPPVCMRLKERPHVIRTSSVRIALDVTRLAFPRLHRVELELYAAHPHHPERRGGLLGRISKMIMPRDELPVDDRLEKQLARRAKHHATKTLTDAEIKDAISTAVAEAFPDLDLDADRVRADAVLNDALMLRSPRTVEFIARGVTPGRYFVTARILRRDMLSDTGVRLPAMANVAPARTMFEVQLQPIQAEITHVNGVVVDYPPLSPSSSASSSSVPLPSLELHSSSPSLLINYTAYGAHDRSPYVIPLHGSLSVVVDGRPWRGPLIAFPDGTSVLIGMLSDGLHTVEMACVDSVDGEPVPESAGHAARMTVHVRAVRAAVTILSPKPDEILDSDDTVFLEIGIETEEEDDEEKEDEGTVTREEPEFVPGRDGYVRVQLDNNTDFRLFSHAGPYKISNVPEGVHTIEVLLVDIYQVPIVRRSGNPAMAVTRFAFMVHEDEKRRRRKVKALEGAALKAAMSGDAETAINMIDVVRKARGPDAPGGDQLSQLEIDRLNNYGSATEQLLLSPGGAIVEIDSHSAKTDAKAAAALQMLPGEVPPAAQSGVHRDGIIEIDAGESKLLEEVRWSGVAPPMATVEPRAMAEQQKQQQQSPPPPPPPPPPRHEARATVKIKMVRVDGVDESDGAPQNPRGRRLLVVDLGETPTFVAFRRRVSDVYNNGEGKDGVDSKVGSMERRARLWIVEAGTPWELLQKDDVALRDVLAGTTEATVWVSV